MMIKIISIIVISFIALLGFALIRGGQYLHKEKFFKRAIEVNKEDKELLNKILKAIKIDNRGSNNLDKLKKNIIQDINDFSDMLVKRFEGAKVQEITENYDTTLIKVWSNYIKVSNRIILDFDLNNMDKNEGQYDYSEYIPEDNIGEEIHLLYVNNNHFNKN